MPKQRVPSEPGTFTFTSVSRRQIKRVQALFNDRPRKVLAWHSPAKVFKDVLERVALEP